MSSIFGYTGSFAIGLTPMAEHLKHWNPDREGIYSDDEIQLGCLENFTTNEAKLTPQPFVYQKFTLVANARIDNRDELAKLLEINPFDELSDIQFIAFSFEKWGKECLKYLVGDFAFVIWDKTNKELFGARDHIGIKTLYYSIVGTQFVFSSEIKGICSFPDFSSTVNEKYFVHGFSLVSLPSTETPYTEIHQLPSGCSFTWKNEKMTIERYWEFGKKTVEIPKTVDAQIEEFNRLVDQAVECRLRTSAKIGAEVSGGLDSTGIAAIAMEKLGVGTEFYSYCYGKSKESVWEHDKKDDSEIVKKFCERYQISDYLNVVNEEDFPIETAFELLEKVYDDQEDNGVPFFTGSYLPAAQKKGVKVMLSGWGGDQVVTNSAAGLFIQKSRNRKYVDLWKSIRMKYSIPKTMIRFGYHVVKGLNATKFFKENLNKNQLSLKDSNLKQSLIEKYNLHKTPGDRYGLKSVDTLKEVFQKNIGFPGLEKRCYHHDLTGKHFGIEFRFPLLDVRLLNYMYSLPETTISPNYQQRFLFTNAVKDKIPYEVIALRKSKVPTTPFGFSYLVKHKTIFSEKINEIAVNTTYCNYFAFPDEKATEKFQEFKKISLAVTYHKSIRNLN